MCRRADGVWAGEHETGKLEQWVFIVELIKYTASQWWLLVAFTVSMFSRRRNDGFISLLALSVELNLHYYVLLCIIVFRDISSVLAYMKHKSGYIRLQSGYSLHFYYLHIPCAIQLHCCQKTIKNTLTSHILHCDHMSCG